MELRDVADGRRDLFLIDPRKIKVRPDFNARDFSIAANQEHVAGLAGSIKEVGVRQPLTVELEGEEIFLVDGECRLRAVMKLIEDGDEIKTVPCQRQPKSNAADKTLDLVLRNGGKSLDMLEQLTVYQRLIGWGWTSAQIAAKIGKTTSHVQHVLDLAEAPEEAKAMIRAGTVAASTVMSVLRSDGPAETVEVLRAAETAAKAAGKTKVTPKRAKAASPKAKAKTAAGDAERLQRRVDRVQKDVDELAATLVYIFQQTDGSHRNIRKAVREALERIGKTTLLKTEAA